MWKKKNRVDYLTRGRVHLGTDALRENTWLWEYNSIYTYLDRNRYITTRRNTNNSRQKRYSILSKSFNLFIESTYFSNSWQSYECCSQIQMKIHVIRNDTGLFKHSTVERWRGAAQLLWPLQLQDRPHHLAVAATL